MGGTVVDHCALGRFGTARRHAAIALSHIRGGTAPERAYTVDVGYGGQRGIGDTAGVRHIGDIGGRLRACLHSLTQV
jgi:hypothetical protein